LSHGGFYIPRLFKWLPRNLEGLTILDAGQGRGEVAYYIRAFSDRPASDFHGQPYIVGVDLHAPHIEFAKKYLNKIYDETYVLNLLNVEEFFKGKHFDMAMLLEVPEHIPKDLALKVLDQVELVADYILIATPYGDELNQDYGDKFPEFNHVSIWMPEDFEKRGYKVWVEDVTPYPRGIQGLRWVYKLYRRLRGRKMTWQRKIIAVRNPKNVEVSGGLNFAGLRGKV
jgi:SAM-dependent methyltransferase